MTFSMLQGNPTASDSISSPYIPSGTDEAEAKRYADAMNHLPVGEEMDYGEDFADAGFAREENR
jgi:hypothetical protein